ncbi:hypothetical protein [Leucobacter chinensis]|uniref:hypothetical protein n=1 Tax=Leucobacter chinensis TaxID=2851010 RepID=UPI001C22A049|nr:hypothetical protein [Leucobacter chinensis]
MRYFFAILSLLTASVLLVLGIGQRTFLAPETSVKHEITEITDDSEYVVIPAEIFELEEGNPSVVVSGENVFLALAEQRDIDGWLAESNYSTAQQVTDRREITSKHTKAQTDAAEQEGESEDEADAESESVAHPQGSDLWLNEYDGETSLKVAVSPEKSQALLVTAGDKPSAPTEVYVIWAQERGTPLAGPLLVTGGLFAALGIILYLFAVDHDRRGLGPRRGRRGPFLGLRNRRVRRSKGAAPGSSSSSRRGSRLGFAVAGVLSVGVAVSGCSASYWPQPAQPEPVTSEPTVDENLAVVPVTDQQIDRILDRVVSVANEGDAELDASVIESRFAGAALAERTANYKVRAANDATAPLPFLTTERLRYDLIQSTEKWPRTLFLTVESSDSIIDTEAEEQQEKETDDAAPEESEATDDETVDPVEPAEDQSPTVVLLLRQDSPRDNYKVLSTISLRGGIEMPAAAPLDEGTAVLSNDIKTLRLSPQETAETFASILQQGSDKVEASELFSLENEALLEKFGANWPTQNCIEGLKCSESVTAVDEPVATLSTGQGGALIVATLREDHVMEIESERDLVKLSDVEKALGLDGAYSKVTRQWQHSVLFYVPTADSKDSIQILGSSTQVIGATGTKKEID